MLLIKELVKMGTQIKIYVVKTELLKDSGILNKNALNLLNALREELISLYGGLSVSPTFKGYWIDTKTKNVDSDINEIWELLTELDLLNVANKEIASKTARIIECVKIVTKQKSQLFTINRNIEINFI